MYLERGAGRVCGGQRLSVHGGDGGRGGGDHDAGPGAILSGVPGVCGEGRAAAAIFAEGGE